MSSYENALRDCLRDCQALFESHREGKLRYEQDGQVKATIRDINLLLNREDCPTYDYAKSIKQEK